MATAAEIWTADRDKGRWRVARKDHGCEIFFSKHCRGDGLIHKGDRYFDTEELREWTSGPIFYRVCSACASHDSSVQSLTRTERFTGDYADSFAA